MITRGLSGVARWIRVGGSEELRQRGFELGFLGRIGTRLLALAGAGAVGSVAGGGGGITRASCTTIASASIARALLSTLPRHGCSRGQPMATTTIADEPS